MDNVLALARVAFPDKPVFIEWLDKMVEGVEEKSVYQSGDVFPMLGYSQRIYQVWEQRPDYPKGLRKPRRSGGNRVYTAPEVVVLAHWVWSRRDRRRRKGGD